MPIGEQPHLAAPDRDRPENLGPTKQRDAENRPEPSVPRELTAHRIHVCLGLQVGNMHRPSFADHVPRERTLRQGEDGIGLNRSLVGHETQHVAVDPVDRRVERVAQTGRARRHRREHRPDVRRRARDHA